MKKVIVLSGINIRFEGGPLSIFRMFLDKILKEGLCEEYDFIVMVSNKNLFADYLSYFNFLEFPKARNVVFRYYFEYFWFNKYSKSKNIWMWISLNDKTPKVNAEHQLTYCHNAAFLYKCRWKDIKFEPDLVLYTSLYKYIYQYNIKRNTALIVQSQWIADEFKKVFRIKNLIVFPPISEHERTTETERNYRESKGKDVYVFMFPTAPKSYKNIEVIIEATKRITTDTKFEVWLTISGNENRYAKYIKKLSNENDHIRFLGWKTKNEMGEIYREADCLIFPSLLESWGLPLSEFQTTQKKILCSDLPYAHETIGKYSNCMFFDPSNPNELAEGMMNAINGDYSNEEIEQVGRYPIVSSFGQILQVIEQFSDMRRLSM